MAVSIPPAVRVRVGIPHFFREDGTNQGYGSSRPKVRQQRCLALARCLQALLAQGRAHDDLVLHIAGRCLQAAPALERSGPPLFPLVVEVHVFTDGSHRLEEVLQLFDGQIQVHSLDLEDPRQLPLACRDHLVAAEPRADLSLYLEDDLVLSDPLFFDKQRWFLERSGGRAVLMPHRYELIPGGGGRRLLIDGPLKPEFIERFCQPKVAVASARFLDGQQVSFDRTANPHSGLFCVNSEQILKLRQQPLPRQGFVTPLETAATLTVLQQFAVLKPALAHRAFLWMEHGHPSFLGRLRTFPHCGP
ncbi:hypothetical protein [Cyanobium sp. LEGE 06113]|uniref:hypothetical protein n=1 Tax=Cyanobium sp. LEGE 06113 TaxID=1297573 RepID=UPI00187FDDBB|nr:hypothetical protein [Cyanobium sp. LEGE 06113]MBE9154467.1 hypothetical protein [Cyanobium sp. LEGE 06113]